MKTIIWYHVIRVDINVVISFLFWVILYCKVSKYFFHYSVWRIYSVLLNYSANISRIYHLHWAYENIMLFIYHADINNRIAYKHFVERPWPFHFTMDKQKVDTQNIYNSYLRLLQHCNTFLWQTCELDVTGYTVVCVILIVHNLLKKHKVSLNLFFPLFIILLVLKKNRNHV